MKKQLVLICLFLLSTLGISAQSIYYTESSKGTINRASMGPSAFAFPTVLQSGLNTLGPLVVAQQRSKMYYLREGGSELIRATLATAAQESVVITEGAMAELANIAFDNDDNGIWAANGPEVGGIKFIPNNNENGGSDFSIDLGPYSNDVITDVEVNNDEGTFYFIDYDESAVIGMTIGSTAVDFYFPLTWPLMIDLDQVNNFLYVIDELPGGQVLRRIDLNNLTISGTIENLGSTSIDDMKVYPGFNKVYFSRYNTGIFSVPTTGGAVSTELSLPASGQIFFDIQFDFTLPTVNTLSPVNGAANIATDGTFGIVFSESVKISTAAGSAAETGIRVMRTSDNAEVAYLDRASAFVVTNGTNTVSFSFPTPLDANTSYYILIGNKVFSDFSSNNFAGISGTSTWTFTTLQGVALNQPNAVACFGTYKSYPAITITETDPGNFKPGTSVTVFFTFSSTGYLLENTTGTITATGDDITINSFLIGTNQIRITYTITGTTSIDAITISGMRINTNDELNPPTTLIRSTGTGVIDGLEVNKMIATISSQAQPPEPGITFPSGSVVCLDDDATTKTVTGLGTFQRWFTANNLLPASFINPLNDRATVSMSELGIDTSVPGIHTRYVRQNVGGCISLATQIDFEVMDLANDLAVDATPQSNCVPPNGLGVVTDLSSNPVTGYDFQWSDEAMNNISTASTLTGMVAGNYNVRVRHQVSGCQTVLPFAIADGTVLPVVNSPSGEVCEDVAGGSTTNVDLTTYNSTITGVAPNLSVSWKDASDNLVSNAVVSSNDVYTYVVTSTATGCVTEGDMVFTVRPSPSVAAAGSDQSVCSASANLEATTPISGTGSWSIITGVGGFLGNASSPTSTFTGVDGSSYLLRWTVTTNALCGSSSDDVAVAFIAVPTTSVAGSDQAVCGTSVILAGNTPVVGTGSWSVVAGSGGSFATTTSPTSEFTGVAGTVYTLRWTITGSCTNSTDDVNITLVTPPTTSVAGPDLAICGNSATLAANAPTVGTGAWTIVSGAGGSFADASSPASDFSGTTGTSYTLRWTVSNPGCAASSDDVVVVLNGSPTTAGAGTDQNICGTSLALTANTPTVGTGEWTVVTGTGGSFANATVPTTTFTGTAGTTYSLRWTIANGGCPSSSDDVSVTLVAPPTIANAGSNLLVCNTSTPLAANTPAVGSGSWSVVTGTGGSFTNASSPTSTFSGTAGVAYTLRWTITNGSCTPSTDDITVTLSNPLTVAQAGADQTACGTSVALGANTPTSGTGSWSIISGVGGSVTSPGNAGSAFTGILGRTYTLRWTIARAGCPSSTDDVSVTLNSAPTGTAVINNPPALCEGSSTILTVTGINGATSFEWTLPSGLTGSSTTSSINITAASGNGGQVSVAGVNNCGTGTGASVNVSVNNAPSLEISLPPTSLPEEVVTFAFTSDIPVQSVEWDLGDGTSSTDTSPQHSYGSPGNYSISLFAIGQNGCEGSATTVFAVSEEALLNDFAIKNIISANGDDKNRVLYIESLDRYPDNEVRFLDRWGVELFSSKNYQNDWEARGKDGQFLPAGQYICVVKLNGSGKVLSRTVSIIRGR